MQEMNIFSPNGQQYEIVDKKARENIAQNAQNITTKADKTYVEEELLKKANNTSLDAKLDKEPIPMALPVDTQEVRRKEDGSLWTKPGGGGSGGGGAVDSVNGQTGDVILSLADLSGDELHRTVTDKEKDDWIVKSSVGKATPDDTQEVHVTPDGKLVTAPSGGGISPEIVVTTDPNATVTATSGLKVVTGNTGDDGKCSLKVPSFGVWEVSARKGQQNSNTVSVTVDSVKQYKVTLTFFSAAIVVTAESGATVTATLGSTVLTEESTGTVTFTVYEKGLWKLKAEKASQSAEKTVDVTESNEYQIELIFISKTLNDNSWDDIHRTSLKGEAENYWSVGDTKNITINGQVGNTRFDNLSVDVFIIGFNHNAEKEGNNLIHFQIGEIGGKAVALCDSKYNTSQSGNGWFNWNPNNSNVGGWASSYRRKTLYGNTNTPTNPLSGSLMAALPPDLRAVMQPVTKYTDNTGNSSNVSNHVTATTDYLWDLSEFEVQGTRSYANQYEQNSQQQYQYYKAGNPKIAYNHTSTASAVRWGLRSAGYNYYSYFCIVYTDGSPDYDSANRSGGLWPGFAA